MLPMYANLPYPSSRVFTSPLKDQGQSVDKTVLKLIQELKEGGRVEVDTKPVYIFLFKDGQFYLLAFRLLLTDPNQTGTVISIHPDSDLKFAEPIRRRLMQRDTGLRTSADASFLVHGLLDLGSYTQLSPYPVN